MIDNRQKHLIRDSFARLRLQQDEAGAAFYRQLFDLCPALLPLFKGVSMPNQAAKLMHVLAYAVDHLDGGEELAATVEQLGARHVAYGVLPDHYSVVGTALINTLATTLGSQFLPETEEAWTDFYSYLSLLMERGARRL